MALEEVVREPSSPGSRGCHLGEAGPGGGAAGGGKSRGTGSSSLCPDSAAGGRRRCAPHCVDNRNHKIAITVSEAVNKRDIPGL